MELIVKNLSDPAWWFTGIFFILVGILLRKLFLNWIPSLWGKSAIFFPERLNRFNRWNKKRVLLLIKNNRQKDMYVVWMIGRYWTLALLSLICITLMFLYFALSKNITIEETITTPKILIPLSFYGLMFITALHKKTLMKLIKEHHRWKRNQRLRAR